MSKIADNLKYFVDNHGEIYEAYENYGKLIHECGGPLDEKTRALLKIVISATCKHEYALTTHIKKAINSGCSKEEIEHALLLTAPTAGFPSMMESIMIMRSLFE